LNGFVEGIKTILKTDGVAVIEVPHIVPLIDHNEFDTIYHQHLCYFSVTTLDILFRRHGLFLNDIKQLPIHGGSLRLYVGHNENVQSTVTQLLQKESEKGITTFDYYQNFSPRTQEIKQKLMHMLTELKQQRKSIVGYGALRWILYEV